MYKYIMHTLACTMIMYTCMCKIHVHPSSMIEHTKCIMYSLVPRPILRFSVLHTKTLEEGLGQSNKKCLCLEIFHVCTHSCTVYPNSQGQHIKYTCRASLPRPIPSFSILHFEKVNEPGDKALKCLCLEMFHSLPYFLVSLAGLIFLGDSVLVVRAAVGPVLVMSPLSQCLSVMALPLSFLPVHLLQQLLSSWFSSSSFSYPLPSHHHLHLLPLHLLPVRG